MPILAYPSTLSAAAAAIAAGVLDPVDLTEQVLARIAALNPALNAYITVDADKARAMARSARQGPLHGLPIGLKDLFDLRGARTTAGSQILADRAPAAEDAAAVARLRAAGAVFLGKTNMHEWALGITNLASHFGPVHNPWDLDRVPGGSSGGSAAAVAAGLALAATGTDTGGSIRIPAALCGITGLKPTYGRVSLHGVIPLSWSLDHAGALTRTVRDAALMLSVMAGYDPQDPYSVDVPCDDYLAAVDSVHGEAPMRIGVPREYFWDNVDPDVETAVRAAIDTLGELGATIVPVSVGDVVAVRQASGNVLVADAAAYHESELVDQPERFTPAVYERMSAGLRVTGIEVARARRLGVLWQHRLAQLFDDVDLIATPAVAIPAPTFAAGRDIKPGALTRFTNPFNLSGNPAISVPCGFTPAGLPAGLQLVGRWWQETVVLRAAEAYQTATEWHLQVPPL